ncbi:hypothetical protein [Actinopolyspora alba]|nr:hypothetical protein [Actinopolyspora alba]
MIETTVAPGAVRFFDPVENGFHSDEAVADDHSAAVGVVKERTTGDFARN